MERNRGGDRGRATIARGLSRKTNEDREQRRHRRRGKKRERRRIGRRGHGRPLAQVLEDSGLELGSECAQRPNEDTK